jgi:hypothetical protein
MKDKMKTICYVFPYDLNTRLTFIVSLSMIFRLCFFSCYNMVAKFLLQDYVFYAHILSSLIPALNSYIDDQDCDCAYHLKNYSFIITYLLEDEQELSLGMLDMSQTYL